MNNEKDEYVVKEITGTITTRFANKVIETKYFRQKKEDVSKYIEKKNVLTDLEVDKILEDMIDKGNEILKQDKIDLRKANQWVDRYKKFVIVRYGVNSEEFRTYENTTFAIPFILTSPSILRKVADETMRKGIQDTINYIVNQN